MYCIELHESSPNNFAIVSFNSLGQAGLYAEEVQRIVENLRDIPIARPRYPNNNIYLEKSEFMP